MTVTDEQPPQPPQEQAQSPERVEVLREAASLISGDREKQYGPPAKNFETIAMLWSAVLGIDITAHQVGLCMNQLKIARIINGEEGNRENYVDGLGYLALAWEVRDR